MAALFGRRGPQTPLARGIAALERGRPLEALASFDEALRAASDDATAVTALNKRGVALVALERRDEALAAFCDALERDERCAPALVNIGNLLLEEGQMLDALDYYDGALRADERCAAAHHHRGIALKRLGRRGEAVTALRKAARLEGRRSPARA